MELKYIKSNLDDYKTVRNVLKSEFKLSSKLILKLKKSEKIFLNSEFSYLDKQLQSGDIVSVDIDFNEDSSNIIPTKMNLDILYEDDYLLIVNKSAGIAVHPSLEHYTDSLSNGIKYYFQQNGLNRKIRPVNRLDRNTSGIVIFAKNQYIQERLSCQMRDGSFKKQYIAFCNGSFKNKSGIIDANIARRPNSIIERCVSIEGQRSITYYEVLEEKNNISKVLVNLKTGRTHQIRVHMSYIGHPIVGDDLYGEPSTLINRQALHAYSVSFIHPITNKNMSVIAELPDDMSFLYQ